MSYFLLSLTMLFLFMTYILKKIIFTEEKLLVSASALMAAQEGVKTPHRIELCEERSVCPARNYRKRK